MSDFDEALDNVIVLTDSDGREVQLEFLDLIPYRGKEYVVLMPLEDDDGEVVILQVDDDPTNADEESYVAVEDDRIVQAVFEIFKEKNKDDFDFSGSEEKSVSGKKMKVRARLGVLFMAWIGAWAGLHFHWMGFHEAGIEWRRKLGGIFCLVNPVAWILHCVEVFKVLFGGYRTDAYGRPIRYFAPFRKVK